MQFTDTEEVGGDLSLRALRLTSLVIGHLLEDNPRPNQMVLPISTNLGKLDLAASVLKAVSHRFKK